MLTTKYNSFGCAKQSTIALSAGTIAAIIVLFGIAPLKHHKIIGETGVGNTTCSYMLKRKQID
jgi:hypothetical protein